MRLLYIEDDAMLRESASTGLQHASHADSLMQHGSLVLNTTTHAVTLAGAGVALSAREFSVLQALLERPGAVLSVPKLEEKIYGWGDEVGSNTVEV